MVTPATTNFTPGIPAAPEPSSAPTLNRIPIPIRQDLCPRCQGRLYNQYGCYTCAMCGYEDPRHVPSSNGHKSGVNIVSAGTIYVLRYMGESVSLSNKLITLKVVRVRTRVGYLIKCPFCTGQMEQSSLSGKRRENREERYKCLEGHRVSLLPSRNGAWGWK